MIRLFWGILRAMAIPRVQRRSLPEGVFEALTSAILHGDLAPGEVLPAEPALSELLGVKRGVLREGLKRLEQAGLVEARQGGGTFVCDYRRRAGLDLLPALLRTPAGRFDPAVVRSVMEMRSALAPDVAALAARRRDEAQLARLRAHTAALAEAPPGAVGSGSTLSAFWDELVDASGNVAYRLAYNALLAVADLGGESLGRLLAAEREPFSDYASLVAAVSERDAEGAHALAARIVRRGQEAVARALPPAAEEPAAARAGEDAA